MFAYDIKILNIFFFFLFKKIIASSRFIENILSINMLGEEQSYCKCNGILYMIIRDNYDIQMVYVNGIKVGNIELCE